MLRLDPAKTGEQVGSDLARVADQVVLLAIGRDVELLEWLDHLGYDEAWIGEHHSAGWELIASPELIIAAAAERTKHIKLGSGVTSLPYHHPLLVAQRFVQLGLEVVPPVGVGEQQVALVEGRQVRRHRGHLLDHALPALG